MLSDVSGHNLSVLRRGIVEDPLDQIVSVLVAGYIDQRDASTIAAPLANSIEVTPKEIRTTNLQALLDNFGGKLVGAIFGCITDDMVNGSAAIWRSAVLANMLDAPVTELAMGHDIDVGKYFFNARTLDGL